MILTNLGYFLLVKFYGNFLSVIFCVCFSSIVIESCGGFETAERIRIRIAILENLTAAKAATYSRAVRIEEVVASGRQFVDRLVVLLVVLVVCEQLLDTFFL